MVDVLEPRRDGNDALQQAALVRVGQMAAVVAHEVKNPLAGIKGVVQVLMSRRAHEDPERTVMADVIDRIDALNELIQDLLLFARPRPLRIQTLDLRVLIEQTAECLRADPAATAVDIRLALPPMPLRGDVELLKAVFLNVLLNAAQAMDGRGQIEVRGCRVDGRCHIEIADTGPGVPEDMRDTIFEPFITTKSRGGGLGLPIARRTVELHGGTLTLTCPPSGGTQVAIVLPG